MKFSDIVKFDSDSPREPGIIKGDFQGDMIDPETLEKAVYDYVEESRDGGEMHKRLGVAGYPDRVHRIHEGKDERSWHPGWNHPGRMVGRLPCIRS